MTVRRALTGIGALLVAIFVFGEISRAAGWFQGGEGWTLWGVFFVLLIGAALIVGLVLGLVELSRALRRRRLGA
ncbi:MAG TPA: hypothetical protein VFU33_06685 [Gaiellaceae bacterium]|nr:hypothetical protein [Gaiellaceae bacterium]